MKLLVFGATGSSGRLLVRKALAAGHDVTAFVRRPEMLASVADVNLTVAAGKLTDHAAIRRAIIGQEAVVSLLGPTRRSNGTPIADGMRHIVATMEQRGVNRLIATSTPSVTASEDRFSLPYWLTAQYVRTFAGGVWQEHVDTAAVVRGSSLAWTVVRLSRLTDRPAKAPAFAGYVGDPALKLSLSRDALVDFLLAQLEAPTWVCKSPALSDGS